MVSPVLLARAALSRDGIHKVAVPPKSPNRAQRGCAPSGVGVEMILGRTADLCGDDRGATLRALAELLNVQNDLTCASFSSQASNKRC